MDQTGSAVAFEPCRTVAPAKPAPRARIQSRDGAACAARHPRCRRRSTGGVHVRTISSLDPPGWRGAQAPSVTIRQSDRTFAGRRSTPSSPPHLPRAQAQDLTMTRSRKMVAQLPPNLETRVHTRTRTGSAVTIRIFDYRLRPGHRGRGHRRGTRRLSWGPSTVNSTASGGPGAASTGDRLARSGQIGELPASSASRMARSSRTAWAQP